MPSKFLQINEKQKSRRIFPESFREIHKYRFATIALFLFQKRKITPHSSKNIKKISEKFKNIPCCKFAIPEIRNIPEK